MNFYTNAMFFDIFRSQKYDFFILTTIFTKLKNATTMIAQINKNFRNVFQFFRVKLLEIMSVLKNINFVHLKTNVQIIVKFKKNHCRIIDEISSTIEHYVHKIDIDENLIFSWNVEWNWILTIINDDETFLILRDDISLS